MGIIHEALKMAEEKNRKINDRVVKLSAPKKVAVARKKLKSEIALLESSLRALEKRYDNLRKQANDKFDAFDDLGYVIANKLVIFFIPGSLIIAAPLSALFGFGFFHSYILAYSGFCFFFLILPYIQYLERKKRMELVEEKCSVIRHEIGRKKKSYGPISKRPISANLGVGRKFQSSKYQRMPAVEFPDPL